MFRNEYQKGYFSIFHSLGSSPMHNWAVRQKFGYCKRITDEDIKSVVLEIMGNNVATTYMYTPKCSTMSLGLRLPFLVMLIKNMRKYFTFEVKILDDSHTMRRFRVSNFQTKTSVEPFCTCMPMGMSEGWNQIHFNLSDFTRRAYGTNYVETVRLQIHANVRIRRIYFADNLYSEDELPDEYRLMRRPKENLVKHFKTPAARPPSPVKSMTQFEKPFSFISKTRKTDQISEPSLVEPKSILNQQEAPFQEKITGAPLSEAAENEQLYYY